MTVNPMVTVRLDSKKILIALCLFWLEARFAFCDCINVTICQKRKQTYPTATKTEISLNQVTEFWFVEKQLTTLKYQDEK